MTLRKQQRGFGLIEVLIAALVIGLGIAALTRLQGDFLKATSSTSQREVALKLAHAKLDDLRSFSFDDGVGGFNFADIANNAGGRSDELTAGNNVVYKSHNFALSWQVTDYKLEGGAYVATTDPADTVEQKAIVVNVSWTDANGRSQTLSLPYTLSPTNPDTGTASSGGAAGLAGDSPTVAHQDAAAPDVIDIDLGDGSKRETSKPLPEVESKDGIVLVQFDSINFDNGDDQKIVQEDNLTVSCNCEKSLTSAETNNPVQLKWADSELYWEQIGTSVKPTGTSLATGTSQAVTLCNRCCADHFDAGSGGADRLENHYSYDSGRWGNKRYYLDGDTFREANAGDAYLEACRLMRINGHYVLMPDWQQVNQEVMTRNHLSSTATVAEYQTRVETVLKDFASQSKNYETDPEDYEYAASTTNFPQRSIIISPFTSTRTQFMGRAIYVDPIENYGDSPSSMPLNAYPFHEINNTLLADWALYDCGSSSFNQSATDPTSSCTLCTKSADDYDCGDVAISNQPVAGSKSAVADADYYQGYYSRGELTYNTSASGNFIVKVTSRKSNSGVTGTGPISQYDADTVFERFIGVAFDADGEDGGDGSGTGLTVGGRIFCYTAALDRKTGAFESWTSCDKKTFSASVTSSIGDCPDQPVLQGSATPSFGCVLPADWIADDGVDNDLTFAGSGATFTPSVISELDVAGTADKEKLCVVMISGAIPADASAIPSCSYDSGK
ncbi:prepilin-type N-terminal cleavage/methylation domain-containing protein [Ferrimonas balearica]|uniref:prepilin-type N-terminal cleavage/methylation domain-containing protein n=1 Tax=Ferrimonas balearica TaxID=44012 RepID=UPI001F2E5A68|nr:prepilin-type N-terminal cleavage/methylation domain-containing protein [Ferrimonas balearica]MBY6095050.1 prepilin-type N-terminal cleavage/methylation domain-containing protein [Ferrimonas balearica]